MLVRNTKVLRIRLMSGTPCPSSLSRVHRLWALLRGSRASIAKAIFFTHTNTSFICLSGCPGRVASFAGILGRSWTAGPFMDCWTFLDMFLLAVAGQIMYTSDGLTLTIKRRAHSGQ